MADNKEPLVADAPPAAKKGILDGVGYVSDDPGDLSCLIGYQALCFLLGFVSGGVFFWIGALTPCCFSTCFEGDPPEGMKNDCCECARIFPKHRIDQMFWCANAIYAILAVFAGSTAAAVKHEDFTVALFLS